MFLRILIAVFLMTAAVFGADAVPLAKLGLTDAKWKPGKFGKLEGRRMVVQVPEADKEAMNCAEGTLDLSKFRGQALIFSIQARAREVSPPLKRWNGVKFMLSYRDGDGRSYWHHPSGLQGSFDWTELNFVCSISPSADTGLLKLGLQDSSGEVEFDLSTLKISNFFPRVNQKYQVSYPERIARTPPLRGVMSPGRALTESDLKTLAEWKVKLVRLQLKHKWGKTGTDRDLAEYDRWLNGRLDELEALFTLARPYGIRFVIDLHSPPGGRNESLDFTMLYEKKYADHFIAVWERMAKRFKGNPSVWAYDLVNEPKQGRPALYDYWTIQRLAAEAIRKIDPDTPIMIASNEWNSANSYRYLSPLSMDNVIYQVHMYFPSAFTHQFVRNTFGEKGKDELIRYPGVIDGIECNKEMLKKHLQPVREFQLRHNARIYVGEFSAAVWAPGAAEYLRDCIEIFEEYGWDWSYHAFREWNGWSVEHEGLPRKLVPSPDNDRKRVLLKGFAKE